MYAQMFKNIQYRYRVCPERKSKKSGFAYCKHCMSAQPQMCMGEEGHCSPWPGDGGLIPPSLWAISPVPGLDTSPQLCRNIHMGDVSWNMGSMYGITLLGTFNFLFPAGLHTALTRIMQIFLMHLFCRAILNSAGEYVTNCP